LLVYSVLSYSQSLYWITFSPIATSTRNYFGVDNATINLWLGWGPIIYIPVVFFTSWVLNREGGLRIVVLLGAFLCFIATGIRCFVFFNPTAWYSIYTIHLAQILNAAVGPFVMASSSKISANWFAAKERTTSTAIATMSNYVGTAVGFLIGPYIVAWSSMQMLIIVEAVHGFIVFIWIFSYFPDKPPTPPSPTASNQNAVIPFTKEIVIMMKNMHFLLFVFIGGWQAGAFNAWSGMFDMILSPLGYSETLAGWLGFSTTVAGIAGGLLVGILGDSLFKRRFKLLLILLFFLCSLTFIWFTLSLPSPFANKSLIPQNEISIIASITIAGLFLGSTNPLFYELSAEMTYPVAEGSSAGLLTLMNNIACVIVLAIGPYINANWINTMVTISIIGCSLLLLPVRAEYRRSNLDDALKGNVQ